MDISPDVAASKTDAAVPGFLIARPKRTRECCDEDYNKYHDYGKGSDSSDSDDESNTGRNPCVKAAARALCGNLRPNTRRAREYEACNGCGRTDLDVDDCLTCRMPEHMIRIAVGRRGHFHLCSAQCFVHYIDLTQPARRMACPRIVDYPLRIFAECERQIACEKQRAGAPAQSISPVFGSILPAENAEAAAPLCPDAGVVALALKPEQAPAPAPQLQLQPRPLLLQPVLELDTSHFTLVMPMAAPADAEEMQS